MATTAAHVLIGATRPPTEAIESAVSVEVRRSELLAVFGAVSGVCLAAAVWFMLFVQAAIGDALSRTLASLTAAHSYYPKLSSLGFIWPPLLGILQIPLVKIPGLSTYGFSGGIVTALFAGGTAVVFDILFARAGLGRAVRLVAIALLMVFNPFMLFHGSNGMSEMLFIFFVTLGTYAFLRWTDTDQLGWLMLGGIASALMVLVRYDAWFYAAAFAGAVALVKWQHEPLGRSGKRRFRYLSSVIAANVVTYATPVAFITALWVLFNWQIKGNPLYFLNSVYSNASIVASIGQSPVVARLQVSPLNFLAYIFETTIYLAPVFPVALLALFALAVARRETTYLALIAILVSVPVFEWVTYRQGQSLGYWRFYITMIPAVAIAVAEVIRVAPTRTARQAATIFLLGGLGLGALTVSVAMETGGTDRFMTSGQVCSGSLPVDREFFRSLRNPTRVMDVCGPEQEMAEYVLARVPGRATLTDVSGEGVVMMSGQPARFVLLSDGDYNQFATNPRANNVTHLITATDAVGYRDLAGYFADLGKEYPPGLLLEKEIGKLRLYRIVNAGGR